MASPRPVAVERRAGTCQPRRLKAPARNDRPDSCQKTERANARRRNRPDLALHHEQVARAIERLERRQAEHNADRAPPFESSGDRDRGESRDSSPPTPPDVRVRIRRFGGLSRPRHRDGSQAKGPQGASG